MKLLVLLLFLSSPAFAENYIILGSQIEYNKSQVVDLGGKILNTLLFHDGFIANLTEQQAKLLKKNNPSIQVEKDGVVKPDIYKKSPHGGQTLDKQITPWGITATQTPEAWSRTRGEGITVCIADTGIDPTHPDLKGQVVGGMNFIERRNGWIDPTFWQDENSHGTHVAGTIAALDNDIGVVGVSPNAKLLAAKVLARRNGGTWSSVSEGIVWCTLAGADVINMSLGGSRSNSILHSAVKFARNRGVIVVASAGNSGGSMGFPGAYPETHGITAMNINSRLAHFSSRGPMATYTAPGVDVVSTVLNGKYASYDGTSMAAPHATGVVALMLSARKNRSVAAYDLGLHRYEQGLGMVNSYGSVTNWGTE